VSSGLKLNDWIQKQIEYMSAAHQCAKNDHSDKTPADPGIKITALRGGDLIEIRFKFDGQLPIQGWEAFLI
jgi:hypothetical protein